MARLVDNGRSKWRDRCAVSGYISQIALTYAQGLTAISDASDSSGTSDGSVTRLTKPGGPAGQ